MTRRLDWEAARFPARPPIERRPVKQITAQQMGRNKDKPSEVKVLTPEDIARWEAANTTPPPVANPTGMAHLQRVRAEAERIEKAKATRAAKKAAKKKAA